MSGFYADNDEFRVMLGNRISFDTNLPSVQLFPDAKITTTETVTFPNLVSTIMYFHQGGAGGQTACESWSALLVQEHGPNRSNSSPRYTTTIAQDLLVTRNIPATTIGTVPSGTNYLDVRVRLRRTITPPVFLRQAPPYMFFPENQWINLPGGSCICEFFSPLVRSFDVVRSGTNVILNRYQSTRDNGVVTESTNGNTNGLSGAAFTRFGTDWGNYEDAPVGRAGFAVFIDAKGSDSSGNKRPPWGSTSSNSCAVRQNNPVDYTSRYVVDFEITPGRYVP